MIRICHVCQRVILGEAEAIPKFSDSGAGRDVYRHPKGAPGCVARPTRRGIAHRG